MTDEGRDLQIADALREVNRTLEALPDYRGLISEERRRRRAWTAALAALLILIAVVFLWDRRQRNEAREEGFCGTRTGIEASNEALILAFRDLTANSPDPEAAGNITEMERRYEQVDYNLAESLPADCDTLDPDLLPTTVP